MSEAILLVVVGLLGFVVAGLAVALCAMLRQQGRMLLRLDAVEVQITDIKQSATPAPRPQPEGLPPGTPVDSIRLPDLTGRMVTLADFRGKRVLLVHWNPRCGFCEQIAPDLARLQPDFHEQNIELLLVSYGDRRSNRMLARKYALACPILLQKVNSPGVVPFRGLGTPVAYLLDEEGRVAAPLAIGADQVPALAEKAAGTERQEKHLPGERPLSESKIEREGLKAGTPAPSFALPDIQGHTVSLGDYAGRRVLLVFSDPHCGPCDQLAPHLARLHEEHRNNNLAVVMVGRGDVDENRRKAEEHRFGFPIVLQGKWELSRQYGIFSTPVAFLISEDGVIARNVARGTDEILALARAN